MLSGFFGYTRRVPSIDHVKSVEISYRGLPDTFVNGTSRIFGSDTLIENNNTILLKDKNDIQIAIGLHEKLANQGYRKTWDESALYNKVIIQYTLNNNRTIYRYYNHITIENLKELLVLDDTKGFHDAFYEQLDSHEPDIFRKKNIYAESLSNNPPSLITYDIFRKNNIYVSDCLSDTLLQIASEKDIAQEIKQAIKKDYQNLPYTERYFPKQKDEYILYFFVDTSNNLPKEIKFNSDKHFYNNYSRMVIDPSYTNTIKVIEKYYKPQENDIEKIYINSRFRHSYNIYNDNYSPFFITSLHEYHGEPYPAPKRVVTDSKMIAKLYKASRGIYHLSDDGYVIHLKVKGKDYMMSRYVPKNLMPEEYKKIFE
jgi:hypothetical protein